MPIKSCPTRPSILFALSPFLSSIEIEEWGKCTRNLYIFCERIIHCFRCQLQVGQAIDYYQTKLRKSTSTHAWNENIYYSEITNELKWWCLVLTHSPDRSECAFVHCKHLSFIRLMSALSLRPTSTATTAITKVRNGETERERERTQSAQKNETNELRNKNDKIGSASGERVLYLFFPAIRFASHAGRRRHRMFASIYSFYSRLSHITSSLSIFFPPTLTLSLSLALSVCPFGTCVIDEFDKMV